MANVCMIGSGYVGLVTGACLAELGHTVIAVDKDESKISTLKKGGIPIYEPGLETLLKKHTKTGRLSFSTDIKVGVAKSTIIFICVNTPPLPDGSADLSFVEACTREVAACATSYKLLVEKSTVPVQTGDRITLALANRPPSAPLIEVASNPEFLREGTAVSDFLKPDRIVIGVGSVKSGKLLKDLYKKIKAPILVTDIKSAELIKHASNSFLAMKISYINSIAQICEKVGADVEQVADGMGYDRRIGRAFLYPGIGYGGSCFPKDVSAFIKIAEKNGFDFGLLKATEKINTEQRHWALKKMEDVLWTFKDKTIAVWGLAFKPNTDDLRNAPALDIIESLLEKGAVVQAYDPVAMEKMKEKYPSVRYAASALEAVKNADLLLIVAEWDCFKKTSLAKVKALLKSPTIVDGRNMFSPSDMKKKGFQYYSVGRHS